MSDADPNRSASGADASHALAEVLLDQAERERRREAAADTVVRRSEPAWLWMLVAVGAALTVWVWVSPPAVVAPDPPPAPSPQDMEAGLRMDMYVAVLRIGAFQDSAGRLPASLEDVFDDPAEAAGLLYEPLDGGRFRLGGVRGDAAVAYRSDRPLQELLGSAPERVRGGAR